MIDVGKCWLTNYDNRTEERDEKSKLTSAFPELVSEPVDTGLEHRCEMSRVCRLGFSQYVVCKSLQNLDFLSWYRERKRHNFLVLKSDWVLGNWKTLHAVRYQAVFLVPSFTAFWREEMYQAPVNGKLALQILQHTKGKEASHQERQGNSQNITWQIWPCVRLGSDSEIIRGNIKLPTLNFQLLSFNGISTRAKECFIYLHHTTSTKFCVRKTSYCKCKTQFVRPLCSTWFSSCCSRRLERIL